MKSKLLLAGIIILTTCRITQLEGKAQVEKLPNDSMEDEEPSKMDTSGNQGELVDTLDRMEQLEMKLERLKEEMDEKLDRVAVKGEQRGIDIATLDHNLRKLQSERQEQIAFSVMLTHDYGPVGAATNIPYDLVYLNVGNGWETSINAFRAPTAGAYVFSAFILSAAGGGTRCFIVHTGSGARRAALWANSDSSFETGANQVILQLEAGDYVSVQLEEGEVHSAGSMLYVSFSGHFLFY